MRCEFNVHCSENEAGKHWRARAIWPRSFALRSANVYRAGLIWPLRRFDGTCVANSTFTVRRTKPGNTGERELSGPDPSHSDLQTYTGLGLYGRSEDLTEHALRIQRSLFGERSRETLASESYLAQILRTPICKRIQGWAYMAAQKI